jgi:lambda repressor-like predicted transcriptional regulator
MDLNNQIKLKVKTLMEKKGWKIPTLAKNAGIHKQTLYNNLEGDTEIKMQTIAAISLPLGVRDMSFWFSDYEMKNPELNGNHVKDNDIDDNDRSKYEVEIRYLRQQNQILTDLVNTKEQLIQRLLMDINKSN